MGSSTSSLPPGRNALLASARYTGGAPASAFNAEPLTPPYRAAVTSSPPAFVLGVALAAAISAGVFAHASRHGSRHATAWGVAAFLFAAITVPVYFIRYWMRGRTHT
jgi:hypothetical protein